MSSTLQIKKIFIKTSENSFFPIKGSIMAAGCDLHSPYNILIPSKQQIKICTNIEITLPYGCYGKFASRSSLAKKNIIVLSDVLDNKEIDIYIYNFSNNDYNIKKGDRIAQIICQKNSCPKIVINNNNNNNNNNMDNILLRKIDTSGIIPYDRSKYSMGYYLYSPEDKLIRKGEKITIPLNIAITIPKGCYGRIALIEKLVMNNIIILGGVIERNFEGNVKIVFYNLGNDVYVINKKDCIGQLICEEIYYENENKNDDEYCSKEKILFKKNDKTGIFPERKSIYNAGYTLYTPTNIKMMKGEVIVIPLNITVTLPIGCYGHIIETENLVRNNISVQGGIIDNDFKGNVKVILYNLGDDMNMNSGDCIGQLICKKIYNFHDDDDDDDDNNRCNKSKHYYSRGLHGFGSSGK